MIAPRNTGKVENTKTSFHQEGASNEKHKPRVETLPISLPPRGISREQAAAVVGVSPSLFDEMVRDRRMPPAKRINARKVWDRIRIEEAFEALPEDGHAGNAANPWD